MTLQGIRTIPTLRELEKQPAVEHDCPANRVRAYIEETLRARHNLTEAEAFELEALCGAVAMYVHSVAVGANRPSPANSAEGAQ